MAEPLTPATGWGVLHLFCRASAGADVDLEALRAAVKGAGSGDGQIACFATLGHKADLGFMAVHPDLWQLRAFQTAVAAAGVEIVDSYVSLTEVSEYAKGTPPEVLKARLEPDLSVFEGKRAVCFYPMSKKREAGANWFALPFEQRQELMFAHGRTGRSFHGRVYQLVTGSTGLDDWEWYVSLFADHPDDLKEVVYTMRFDEASAVYGEFGPFITGMAAPLDHVLTATGLTP